MSADGKPHAARLTTPRGAYRLRVAPGARASVLVAGMRAGRYPMTAGSQHATLVTGGEPGP